VLGFLLRYVPVVRRYFSVSPIPVKKADLMITEDESDWKPKHKIYIKALKPTKLGILQAQPSTLATLEPQHPKPSSTHQTAVQHASLPQVLSTSTLVYCTSYDKYVHPGTSEGEFFSRIRLTASAIQL
jgi:hypothetical protein